MPMNMPMGRSKSASALVAAASIALLAGVALLGRGETEPGGSDAGEAAPAMETAMPLASPSSSSAASASSAAIPEDVLAAPAVRAAVAMAARDAGVAEDQVAVTDVREITWPSSALGCPRPEMMYLEVLTPGYRVMTFAAGARRIYHTDRGAEGNAVVVPCSAAVSKQGGVDLPPAQLEALRVDAARRAAAPDAPVEVVRIALSQAVTLTCDAVAAEAATGGSVSLAGQLIWDVTLRAGARAYRYRVSGTDFVHCGDGGVDEDGNPID